MIKLSKLNGEEILLNDEQMESIISIPESKITMMNREFYIVREGCDEIIRRILEFKRQANDVSLKIKNDSNQPEKES